MCNNLYIIYTLPGRSEDVSGVGADSVDGTVVTFDLAYRGEVVHVPHLHHAPPAGADQQGSPGDEGQGAHPVLMGVGDLLWVTTTKSVKRTHNTGLHIATDAV